MTRRRPTLCILEDNVQTAQLISQVIKHHGINVEIEIANSTVEFIDAIDRIKNLFAVTLDWNIDTNVNGGDAAEKLIESGLPEERIAFISDDKKAGDFQNEHPGVEWFPKPNFLNSLTDWLDDLQTTLEDEYEDPTIPPPAPSTQRWAA